MNVIFYLSYDIKITLKSHFCRKKHYNSVAFNAQRCYGRHNLSRKSINRLSILLHGVISLSDVKSYDKGSLTVRALYAYFYDSQDAAFKVLVWCM